MAARKAHHSPENHDEIYTGYHALMVAIIQTGLGRIQTFTVWCVSTTQDKDGKTTHKRTGHRKYKLATPMYSSPAWIWTDCGSKWASLAGLNRDALFRLAGGVGPHRARCGPTATCKNEAVEE